VSGGQFLEYTRTVRVKTMNQANRIRQFAIDHYIAPARAAGRMEITIRAGDIHKDMGLTNAMPAVCSAIGSRKFDELAGVRRTALRAHPRSLDS
jgi:hypothetical protein